MVRMNSIKIVARNLCRALRHNLHKPSVESLVTKSVLLPLQYLSLEALCRKLV